MRATNNHHTFDTGPRTPVASAKPINPARVLTVTNDGIGMRGLTLLRGFSCRVDLWLSMLGAHNVNWLLGIGALG